MTPNNLLTATLLGEHYNHSTARIGGKGGIGRKISHFFYHL